MNECQMMTATLSLVESNLLSPIVLAYVLGFAAVKLKSDLKLPKGVYDFLSFYLLMALGLKGGAMLRDASLSAILWPLIATVLMGCLLPFLAYHIGRFMGFVRDDAAALAAHYGSVSVVTFMAALVFVEQLGMVPDHFMTALVAVLEIPGLIMALLVAHNVDNVKVLKTRIHSVLVSKSILLLLGGLVIGFISGPKGIKPIAPFFIDPFKGALVLFLLDMGIVSGQHFKRSLVRSAITAYALMMPLLNAMIAIVIGYASGLSVGSTTIFAAMAASASYIAAPAVVRSAIPNANPALYMTASMVITFPFNLAVGIPLYYGLTVLWFHLMG